MKRELERHLKNANGREIDLRLIARQSVSGYEKQLTALPQLEVHQASGANLKNLLRALRGSTEAAITLAYNDMPFEAQSVLRVALEGTSYIYKICLSDEPILTAGEYFGDLLDYYMAQEATSRAEIYEAAKESSHQNLINLGGPSLEMPSYLLDAQERNSRRVRKPILGDWSCGKILGDLRSKPGFEEEAKILISLYSSFSHQAHIDPCGIRIRYWHENYSIDGESIVDVELSNIISVMFYSAWLTRTRGNLLRRAFGDAANRGPLPVNTFEKQLLILNTGLTVARKMNNHPDWVGLSKKQRNVKLRSLVAASASASNSEP